MLIYLYGQAKRLSNSQNAQQPEILNPLQHRISSGNSITSYKVSKYRFSKNETLFYIHRSSSFQALNLNGKISSSSFKSPIA